MLEKGKRDYPIVIKGEQVTNERDSQEGRGFPVNPFAVLNYIAAAALWRNFM
jgi:hypothetical protein